MLLLFQAVSLLPQPISRRAAALGGATSWMVPAVWGSPSLKSWTLTNGVVMPTLALNTAGMTADASERAVREAHAAGITHIDFHPGIERDGVALALRSGTVTRPSLFLTTKI